MTWSEKMGKHGKSMENMERHTDDILSILLWLKILATVLYTSDDLSGKCVFVVIWPAKP